MQHNAAAGGLHVTWILDGLVPCYHYLVAGNGCVTDPIEDIVLLALVFGVSQLNGVLLPFILVVGRCVEGDDSCWGR
jgi:hypothetical protein